MVKQVDCSACEFLIQDENEDELIDFVRQHAENSHEMSVSRADVQEWITEV